MTAAGRRTAVEGVALHNLASLLTTAADTGFVSQGLATALDVQLGVRSVSLAFVVRNSHEELLVAIGDLASEGYKSLVLLHPDATGCGYGRDLHRSATGQTAAPAGGSEEYYVAPAQYNNAASITQGCEDCAPDPGREPTAFLAAELPETRAKEEAQVYLSALAAAVGQCLARHACSVPTAAALFLGLLPQNDASCQGKRGICNCLLHQPGRGDDSSGAGCLPIPVPDSLNDDLPLFTYTPAQRGVHLHTHASAQRAQHAGMSLLYHPPAPYSAVHRGAADRGDSAQERQAAGEAESARGESTSPSSRDRRAGEHIVGAPSALQMSVLNSNHQQMPHHAQHAPATNERMPHPQQQQSAPPTHRHEQAGRPQIQIPSQQQPSPMPKMKKKGLGVRMHPLWLTFSDAAVEEGFALHHAEQLSVVDTVYLFINSLGIARLGLTRFQGEERCLAKQTPVASALCWAFLLVGVFRRINYRMFLRYRELVVSQVKLLTLLVYVLYIGPFVLARERLPSALDWHGNLLMATNVMYLVVSSFLEMVRFASFLPTQLAMVAIAARNIPITTRVLFPASNAAHVVTGLLLTYCILGLLLPAYCVRKFEFSSRRAYLFKNGITAITAA